MEKNARMLHSFEKNFQQYKGMGSPLPLCIYCKLKGTDQQDFQPPFLSSFEPAWAADQWV